MTACHRLNTIAIAAAPFGLAIVIAAQQPAAQPGNAPDRVAALKASIQEGLGKARQYEWTETTIISLKGEEKARKQNRCYYGADGKVVKVPLDKPPAPSADQGGGRGGRRGGGKLKQQIVENKKDDMKEYMERAGALIQKYVPPVPANIQAAKDAGHIKTNPQAAGSVQLAISQYLLPGDSLTLDLNPASNGLVGLAVQTYLDKPEDVVTLAVRMNTLPDGALYPAQTTLDAKAKNITVVVQNSGHRPVAR
jgi:hypothetical protein